MSVSPPDPAPRPDAPAAGAAPPAGEAPRPDRGEEEWLRAFHAGDRGCLERCYRDHLGTVEQVVAHIVTGADRETLVHEVFFRLLSEEALRRRFAGGAFASWLRVVARNQAIDYARRRRLEVATLDEDGQVAAQLALTEPLERQIDLRLTLARFRERVLPAKWHRVFNARFVEHQDQPTAARALGMRRTTLAYQEYRIRRLLHRYVLRGESA
jgi:RNA polymerase sigma-70 factor (ECF subfamily)